MLQESINFGTEVDVIHQFNDSFFPNLAFFIFALLLEGFASSSRSIDWMAQVICWYEDKVIMALSGKVKVRDERSGRDIATGDRFTIET